MATVTFIRYEKQSAGALRGVAQYISQREKTVEYGRWLVDGQSCAPRLAARSLPPPGRCTERTALSGSTTTSSPSTRRSRSPGSWPIGSHWSLRSRPGRTARCSLPPTSTPPTSTRTSGSTPCAMRPGRCCGRAPVLCAPYDPSPTSCA